MHRFGQRDRDICTDSDKGTGDICTGDICTTAIFSEKSSISSNWGVENESNLSKNLQPSNSHTLAFMVIKVGRLVS